MMDSILIRYKKRLLHLSTRALILELSILSILIKIIPGIIISLVTSGPIETTTDFQLQRESLLFVFFTALIAAPLVETILGQWFPVTALSFITKNTGHLVLWYSLFFAVWHYYAGWESVLIVWFPGMVFSLCFLALWDHSFWRAYWVTSLVHALHNLISLLVYFLIAQ